LRLTLEAKLLALGLQLLLAELTVSAKRLPLGTQVLLGDSAVLDALDACRTFGAHLHALGPGNPGRPVDAGLEPLGAGHSGRTFRAHLDALGTGRTFGAHLHALRPRYAVWTLLTHLDALHASGALGAHLDALGPSRTFGAHLGAFGALRTLDGPIGLSTAAVRTRTCRGCDRQRGNARGEKYPGHTKSPFERH
jgi:hypothetical protein